MDIHEKYDLEVDKIVGVIKKDKAKRVLLQFPDGLKPYATGIVDIVSERVGSGIEVFIWFGTCFGACDVPLEVERLGVDLIVQFGHSAWNYGKG